MTTSAASRLSLLSAPDPDPFRPEALADGVWWVGSTDANGGYGANPYLIVDGDEAIVLNSGSRADFPSMLMKILQTGIAPSTIGALIYQNHDARLCGSIPHLEDIIGRPDLRIVSAEASHMFLRHYCERARLVGLDEIDHRLEFRSGRRLMFIPIPYAHSAGSFVTFDRGSGILFSGDLFSGGTSAPRFAECIADRCHRCLPDDRGTCAKHDASCIVPDILEFHRTMMPSERALRFALERIATIPFRAIAPQHGPMIHRRQDILLLFERLLALRGVGIDRIVGDRAFSDLGDTRALHERLGPP